MNRKRYLSPKNEVTWSPLPPPFMASFLNFSRHSNGLIAVAIVSTLSCCMCLVGPPPFDFAEPFTSDEHDCQGDVDHGYWGLQWRWDRCSLPGFVIWSAMYFAHRQNSDLEVRKVTCEHDLLTYSDLSNCRNTVDAKRLIERARNVKHELSSASRQASNRCSSPECQPQYTPFDADQPCPLSTRPLSPYTDGSLSLLPPVTLSLYIQALNHNNRSHWSWWRPLLNFSLSVLNCAEDAAPYFEWNLFTRWFSDNFRCCHGCPHNHFPTDLLRLHANTQYMHDNIFLDTFTSQQFSQMEAVPCSPFRLSISARLLPSDSAPSGIFSNDAVASNPIIWNHHFHASTFRPPEAPSFKTVTRRRAKTISHKLCQTAASYPTCTSNCAQAYDASTHTVLTSFSLDKNRSVSVAVLAASVQHTESGLAVFEALVWAEFDGKCGTDDTLIYHCVGQKLDLAVTCEAVGATVNGAIKQDSVASGHREAVISCEFNPDIFKRSFGEVSVTLSDSGRGFKMLLPLCALAKGTVVRKVVACSQPVYNAKFLEKRWPGVLQAWVLYHVGCTVTASSIAPLA